MQRKNNEGEDTERVDAVEEDRLADQRAGMDDLRPSTPEVIRQDLAVPVVVLTTRDHYMLAAITGILATKSNISPIELKERAEAIVAEVLG